ncbi:MAG: EAL domain-containing protein [Zoogloeaceae bacterium]|jgi:lactose/cellobiose-specific phosphotransferase system IIC component|nr:EAL domain-containing protein [Zoogloeaceae bacterium]
MRLAWISRLSAPRWAFSPTMQAIRNGFLLCLPLVAAGSFAILLNSLPLAAYQEAMHSLFGPGWKSFGALVWQGTFGIIAFPMLIGISHHLAVSRNQRNPKELVSPLLSILVAFASLAVILPSGEGLTIWLGTQGLFISIIVALCSTRLFLRLTRIRRLCLRVYSEGMDGAAPQIFTYLLPGMLTILLFAAIHLAFHVVSGYSIHQLLHELILFPFRKGLLWRDGDSFQFALVFAYALLTQCVWFFGIHGTNVFAPVTSNVFVPATRIDAEAGWMFSKDFLDVFVFMGGSGSSICLLVALLLASRSESSRRLARISILPGIFNINEILLFGLPVILNPLFLIPFILTPLVLLLTSSLALELGLVPPPTVTLDWTTPPILGGYLATHSIAGSLLQVFNIVLGTLLYIPFVQISERVKQERQKQTMSALMEVACANVVGPSGKKCLDRDDEIGVLARVLAGDLEQALKRNEGLYLEYQPLVDHATGEVIGAEALVRWRHPLYGQIPAPIMVAISEDGDFMKPLGLWVLDEACAERAREREGGLPEHFKISVNVSIRQLDDASLPEKIEHCLARYRLAPHMIGIEVTESIALDPKAPHNLILEQISQKGFSISIDDFGMGHSSLVYLKYFPVNTLKIDKALSKDVATSDICMEIIATIVGLCQALSVKIVVEFVENQQQIDVLRKLGCHVFQGYFYSPPLAGEKMLAYALAMNRKAEAK